MLDVSSDNFATVSYRWATGSFVDGSSNRYEARLNEVGKISRGFGADHIPVAGTVNLVLDNTDFAADWLCDRATFLTTTVKSRFRLSLGLYDPRAAYTSHPAITSQVVGTFVCLDFPERDSKVVRLSLADDTLGRMADLALTPSINDWIADGDSTSANCPFFNSSEISKVGNWDAPTQLAFGSATIRLERQHEGVTLLGGAADSYGAIIVCATTDTDASGDTARSLSVEYRNDLFGFPDLAGKTLEIPATFVDKGGTTRTIWSIQRTASISKDSKTWRLQWIKCSLTQYRAWFDVSFSNIYMPSPTSPLVMLYPAYRVGGGQRASQLADNWAAFAAVHYNGYPLSSRRSEIFQQEGVDVIYDLISHYSAGASSSDIDATSFDEVKFGNLAYVSGIIQPSVAAKQVGQGLAGISTVGTLYGVNKLREAITEICASIDADLFISWTGLFKMASLKVSFTDYTTTPAEISETRMANVREGTPSLGERWAPYNRIYVVLPTGEQIGPFDHPTTAAASGGWGKIFPKVISAKWRVDETGWDLAQTFAWQRRLVESTHRPVLRFVTDLSVLTFDLGSYALVSWTRNQGGATPYSAAIFRFESFQIDPKTMAVMVEMVWMHDLQSEKPYLLDSELLIERAAGSGARTLAVTATSAQVTFSSGSLIADGVAAGDILRTYYNPTNEDDFAVARATRIVSVDSATTCTVVWSGWSTTSGITGWKILRGATTYHTAVSDPTNYPSGGAMYGKGCGTGDTFSDASAANLLKDG